VLHQDRPIRRAVAAGAWYLPVTQPSPRPILGYYTGIAARHSARSFAGPMNKPTADDGNMDV
jgi:hypothetical protein